MNIATTHAIAICSVCQDEMPEPIYRSSANHSMTTMMQLYDQPTTVFFCDGCGHLQTEPIVDVNDYYEHQYKILAENDEEDQLYRVENGQRLFQVPHRTNVLLSKVKIPSNGRVLDFGCAKGAMLRHLSDRRPDIIPFLFDVTDRYVPFWSRFAKPLQWSTGSPAQEWTGTMDVVCSFYVLEHVLAPVDELSGMAALLKPGGTLYLLVPNVQANTADLIVADHLQHFSIPSLHRALTAAGLGVVEIDDRAHDSALIAVAVKGPTDDAAMRLLQPPALGFSELRNRCETMSRFWSQLSNRIREFESQQVESGDGAIYGAGFYGNFIASCLQQPASIRCFVDQNPYLQGREMCGKPILAPSELPSAVQHVFVGLNPAVARVVIDGIESWRNRQLAKFYL